MKVKITFEDLYCYRFEKEVEPIIAQAGVIVLVYPNGGKRFFRIVPAERAENLYYKETYGAYLEVT